jgi:hypothetical protein
MGMITTCYMCDQPATSKEHVPPRCLFPKGQRDRLITVPSCDTHNREKSQDDEYLRDVLNMTLQASHNAVSQEIVSGPLMRALFNGASQLA